MELEQFPAPSPNPQTVLNHWTLYINPSPGFGLLYKGKPLLEFGHLFPFLFLPSGVQLDKQFSPGPAQNS